MNVLGQTPAAPHGPPMIPSGQQLVLEKSVRPPDKITVEEMRLDLACRIGPLRLFAGVSRSFTLLQDVPAPIAMGKGQNGVPTFVRIELAMGFFPVYLGLSNQWGATSKLTTQFTGYIDVVLLPHEVLYATAFLVPGPLNLTDIKVTEVIV